METLHHIVHLLLREHHILVNVRLDRIHSRLIHRSVKNRLGIVVLERLLNHIRVIPEVNHQRIILTRAATVKATQRLNALDTAQNFVHIHCVKQLLVEPGLELFRHNQDLVLGLLELQADIVILDSPVVHISLGTLSPVTILHLSGEGNQCLNGTAILSIDNGVDDPLEVGSGPAGIRNNHCLCLSADLLDSVTHKMINYHGCLAEHDVLVLIQAVVNDLQRLFLLEEFLQILVRILLHQLEHGLVADVILQDVQDESLLYGLFHRIQIVSLVLVLPVQGKRRVLWRCGKGIIADVVHHLAHHLLVGHKGIQLVVVVLRVEVVNLPEIIIRGQGTDNIFRTLLPQCRVSLINDNREMPVVLLLDIRQGVGEFLHRTDNDAVSVVDGLGQVHRTAAYILNRPRLHFESYHLIGHIPVENNSVRDHDDAVEQRRIVIIGQIGQLVSQPGH